MNQPREHRRGATSPPPVPIRPLVVVDCLVGGLQLALALFMFFALATLAGTARGSNVPLVIGAAAAMLLAIALLVLAMGFLLFLRRPWTYWLSLIGHSLLLVVQSLGLVGAVVSAGNRQSPGLEGWGLVACNGFLVLLFGLCVHHAWKLIQADGRRNAEIRRLAEEPEMEAAPGWDEARLRR